MPPLPPAGQLDFGEFLRLCRDEDALPLLDILDYAAKGSSARAAAPAAPPAAPSAAAPGIVSTFFSTAEFEAVMAANPDSLIVVMASLTWWVPLFSCDLPFALLERGV